MFNADDIFHLLDTLNRQFGVFGFEFQPFKVSWYNDCVKPCFHLKMHEDTVAVLVISTPQMFEKTFIPYLRNHFDCSRKLDPIDACMIFYFAKFKEALSHCDIESIHDFELEPTRRPKILVQTAAHVSGAAYFYQNDCISKLSHGNKKMYGVCIHPQYGGWFALRGVLLLRNIHCHDLPKQEPIDIVPQESKRRELLELYNYHWADGRFRDSISVIEKYSHDAIKYFTTPPKDRLSVVKDIVKSHVGSV